MKQTEDSDISLYWVLRILTILLPFLFAYLLLQTFIDPSFVEQVPEKDKWMIRLIGVLAVVLFGVTAIRLGRISYGWGSIIAYRNGKKKEYKWSEASRVVKIPGWTPPMYRMSFRNGDKPIYFAMSWWNVSIGVWAWDFTGFYDFAKNMIEAENKKRKDVNKAELTTPDAARPTS
ncbi:hypothetical protein MLD52_22550 [Puniceicoccaceae bacterium K14]|nr:hypothetical protein [Puniceicoccaceae bacterium K14]